MDRENAWMLVDRRYEQSDRYPDTATLEAVDTALTALGDHRKTVRYWHVTGRVDADDSAVVAALDLFAALDVVDTQMPDDPRTTTCYAVGDHEPVMPLIGDVYGYAETPYRIPALE